MIAPSDIYLAAWIASEKVLPEASRKLIEEHDALFSKWREAGWPSPIPEALNEASKRIEADPLASIPFKLRQQTNQAASDERREKERQIVGEKKGALP